MMNSHKQPSSKRRRSIPRPRWTVGFLLTILLMLMPTAALAQQEVELDGKLRTGDEIKISADETFEGNLYLFAGLIDIDGTVDGDVIAGGGQIAVNGTITGDLLVFGGQVDVSGDVEGDVRFIGGELGTSGDVGGDLAMFAGSGTIEGNVGSDLLFGVGQMSVAGDVEGGVFGAGGDYSRSGSISGDEQVTLAEPDPDPSVTDQIVDGLRRTAALFIVAAALLLLMHRPLNRIVDEVRSNPLQCLLYGLLALVALIFAAIAALVAGIAFSIGLAAVGLDLLVGTYWLTLVAVALVAAAAVFLIAVFLAPPPSSRPTQKRWCAR